MSAENATTERAQERAIRIAKALLDKTHERGATEAEANAAFDKANEILTKYGLSITDVQAELESASYGAATAAFGHRRESGRVVFPYSQACFTSVGKFCGVKAWTSGPHLVFFGQREDAQLAHHLIQVVDACMKSEWREYSARTRERNPTDFMRGMSDRINHRIAAMLRQRENAFQGSNTCTGLTVVRDAKVDSMLTKYMEEKDLKLTSRRSSTVHRPGRSGYAAGARAGDRVGLNRPIDGGSASSKRRLS